jgi:methionine-R-sulfoxide reductase
MKFFILAVIPLLSCSQTHDQQKKLNSNNMIKSEEEWKKILSPERYHILREKGTERPFSGKYNLHFEKGVYKCAGCGAELFSSDMKFESHCGWPSFDNELGDGSRIKKEMDYSHGMFRVEIICSNCGGHLGHLFDDGPTPTGKRYCVNSLSLDFEARN